ncbi:MAG: hypothetical protein ACI9CO_000032 [Candidatus Azotimanducaceae bacterium]|jgi:hypothetical protein
MKVRNFSKEQQREQKGIGEYGMNSSSFISKYVEEHKKALEKLKKETTALAFDGQWFIIGDKEYPQKRLQYATTSFLEEQVSPCIILYPAGEKDIHKAIGLCRNHGMALAVRTGGHQYCGYSSTSPANMQMDLSETFPSYEYDPKRNVLRCGVSNALGDWAEKNHKNGIYLPMGVCAHVHLGGHVHTGGWGMVARSHGILADHVLAFEIIFASGALERIVRPAQGETTEHNDDVFYAVLGGSKGGDFGIVTHWEFSPLRDIDYPNSACYKFLWLWTEDKMEGAVCMMEKLSKLCAKGDIPTDYEFMLSITGAGFMNVLSENVKQELQALGYLREDIPVPAVIQMWMCYTNKEGVEKEFDDNWFDLFTHEDVCGEPIIAHRLTNYPVSQGLAQQFIMEQDREMQYPFVKRSRVTLNVPETYAKTYRERMSKIMGEFGTSNNQHLVSQMQIYAGGAVQENGKAGITSYSWREQAFAASHDSFYAEGWFGGDTHNQAEEWQRKNDEVFIEQKAYADADMRMFAYTFGGRDLMDVWPYFYDSQKKYDRLRKIKGTLDPGGLFSPDQFSLKPL